MQDAIPLKKSKSRFRLRNLLLAFILLAITAGAGAGTYLILRGGDDSVRVIIAVEISYPAGWSEVPLTTDDSNAGLLLIVEREKPEASFLARTVIATLATDFDINELAVETVAALSAEVDNFTLLGDSVSPVASFDSVLISYQQKGEEASAPDYQVFMDIVPTPNQTFYLTIRAEKKDFKGIEDEGLDIINAFAANVSASLQ